MSQPWAGKAWGGIAIPRIGQEVIVDFLEGDPDQPIITGRVYNAEQMPPYALPANKTQTGIKSRSSLGGTPATSTRSASRTRRASEQLFIHAEKNQDIEVENDETHWVGHDRKKTIDNDETTHVKHDRTETVDNNETITIHGNRTETVDKDESITNRQQSHRRGRRRTRRSRSTRTGPKTSAKTRPSASARIRALTVRANRTGDVTKDEQIAESARTRSITCRRRTARRRSARTIRLQVGKKLLIDAGDQITIQTGSASITMKKDGTITIKGKDITIDGSGKINVKASSDVVIKGNKISQN